MFGERKGQETCQGREQCKNHPAVESTIFLLQFFLPTTCCLTYSCATKQILETEQRAQEMMQRSLTPFSGHTLVIPGLDYEKHEISSS